VKEALLRLEDIEKSFSGVKVLDQVGLVLRRGTVLGLVGENGAGKSTLMNILGGILPRDGGRMFLEDRAYEPANPTDASRWGIVFIHQELNLFTNLSVAENIFIDGFPRGLLGGLAYQRMYQEARKVLETLGEKVNPRTPAGELPMGTRQMVEISKALKKEARIIIFDEPTTSLSNKEKERLFAIIQGLAAAGVSIIYISHMLDDVFRLCDQIAVLRDGRLIGQEPVEKLQKTQVIRMMVGRELGKLFPYVDKQAGPELLKVENLCQGTTLRGASLRLHEGEVAGLFGLMGAGRSELVKAIYGVDPFDSGTIYFQGRAVSHPQPAQWIHQGVALITENRREEGLLMLKPVRDNLVLAHLKQIRGPFNSVNVGQEDTASEWAIQKLRIRTYDKNRQQATMLSGGNQQKTVVGKWLLTRPRVFLLDEPTRGIDVGAKYELYNHINDLALERSAVLFISSEMEELMGVCDRIMVMCRGRITGELRRQDYGQEALLRMAIEGAA
jgi:ABC-type sugar transport system ATPase subunit